MKCIGNISFIIKDICKGVKTVYPTTICDETYDMRFGDAQSVMR